MDRGDWILTKLLMCKVSRDLHGKPRLPSWDLNWDNRVLGLGIAGAISYLQR